MKAIFVLVFLTSLPLFGQIKVDKAGDGWDLKVDSALALIQKTDSAKYALLVSVCSTVSFCSVIFRRVILKTGEESTSPPET